MAHRKLTLKEQLKGIKAALRSRRTPPQLREGLKKRAAWLKQQIEKAGPKRKKRRSFSFFED